MKYIRSRNIYFLVYGEERRETAQYNLYDILTLHNRVELAQRFFFSPVVGVRVGEGGGRPSAPYLPDT